MFLGVPTLSIASIYGKQLNSTLDWNFAVDRQLADDITFTRASSGTYWDAAGVLQTQTANLLLNNQDYSQANWSLVNATISTDAIVAPDGTLTADKLVEASDVAVEHFVRDTVIAGANAADLIPYCGSVYLKAAERTIVRLQVTDNVTGGVITFADLSAGTISSSSTGGSWTNGAHSIEDAGGGWYRVSVSGTKGNAASQPGLSVTLVSTGTTSSYNGDGSSGVYVWGAQFESYATTPGPYIKTTTVAASLPRFTHDPAPEFTNELTYSEQLDNAAWTKSACSVSADAIAAPDGATTADKVVEDTATNTHSLTRPNFTVLASTAYTISFYAKAAERTRISGDLWNTAAPGTDTFDIDLSTGAVNSAGSGVVVTVTDDGGGWYRVALAFTTAAGTLLNWRVSAHNGTAESYTGDGSSGFYLWGQQIQTGSVASAYLPTTTVAAHSARQSLGLLIEEARTNICLQSEDFGTTWANSRSTDAANTAISPDGTLTADSIIEDGTATNTHYMRQSFTKAGSALAYAVSVYAKASTRSNITIHVDDNAIDGGKVNFNLSAGTAGSVSMVNFTSGSASIENVGGGWYRCAFMFTTTTATGLNLDLRLHDGTSDSYSGDAASGLYIWGAQLEAGAFPTSYIKTTTASVTRAADVATDTSIPWYNQSEGTVILEGSGPTDTTSTLYATLYESSSDYVSVQRNTTAARGQSNGVSIQGGTWATNIIGKVAIGYKLNDYAVAFDGALLGTDASGTPPTAATELRLSSTQTGTQKNGTISRIRYYSKRLPNTKLQALTGS